MRTLFRHITRVIHVCYIGLKIANECLWSRSSHKTASESDRSGVVYDVLEAVVCPTMTLLTDRGCGQEARTGQQWHFDAPMRSGCGAARSEAHSAMPARRHEAQRTRDTVDGTLRCLHADIIQALHPRALACLETDKVLHCARKGIPAAMRMRRLCSPRSRPTELGT